MEMEVFEMSIMINVFLLAYLLAMVLVTILGVVWMLTILFTPEHLTKKAMLMRYQKK